MSQQLLHHQLIIHPSMGGITQQLYFAKQNQNRMLGEVFGITTHQIRNSRLFGEQMSLSKMMIGYILKKQMELLIWLDI